MWVQALPPHASCQLSLQHPPKHLSQMMLANLQPAPTPHLPLAPNRFNLGNAKAAQLKKLTDTTPGCFKRLFNSPLYDALLTKLILYFAAAFQHESLQK